MADERTMVVRSGDPVPAQTSDKATGGGAGAGIGAAVGGLLSALLSGWIVKMTGADLAPDTQANLLIVCTGLGATLAGIAGGYIGAYRTTNYLK